MTSKLLAHVGRGLSIDEPLGLARSPTIAV